MTGPVDRADQPRVLLLHGLLSGRAAWCRVRAELEGEARLAAPDLLGFGLASKPGKSYTLDDVLDHLEPLVDRFQPTHVMGHSMGGIVALALRARYPDAFGAVGLTGLPVYRDGHEARAFLKQRGPVVQAFLGNHGFAHLACLVAFRTNRAWRRVVLRYLEHQTPETMAAVFNHCAGAHTGAFDNIVFAGHVPSIAGPHGCRVALAHGSADNSAPYGTAREVAEEMGWGFETIGGGSHRLIIEEADRVAEWARREVLPHRPGVPIQAARGA